MVMVARGKGWMCVWVGGWWWGGGATLFLNITEGVRTNFFVLEWGVLSKFLLDNSSPPPPPFLIIIAQVPKYVHILS